MGYISVSIGIQFASIEWDVTTVTLSTGGFNMRGVVFASAEFDREFDAHKYSSKRKSFGRTLFCPSFKPWLEPLPITSIPNIAHANNAFWHGDISAPR